MLCLGAMESFFFIYICYVIVCVAPATNFAMVKKKRAFNQVDCYMLFAIQTVVIGRSDRTNQSFRPGKKYTYNSSDSRQTLTVNSFVVQLTERVYTSNSEGFS